MSESKVITIDEAIGQLQEIAATSPLGGDTCLCVCISGIEYQPVTRIKMDRGQEGAIALVMQPYEADGVEDTSGQHSSGEMKFRNFYRCPKCGAEWEDCWDSMCNDECPNGCMKDIEPFRSEDL